MVYRAPLVQISMSVQSTMAIVSIYAITLVAVSYKKNISMTFLINHMTFSLIEDFLFPLFFARCNPTSVFIQEASAYKFKVHNIVGPVGIIQTLK